MNIEKEGQNEVKMVQYIHGFGGYDVQHCGLIRQLPHARRDLHVGCLTWPLSWKTSCFQSICVQIASCHVLMFFFSSRISNFWTSHLRSNLHQLYQTVWLSFGWAASPPCWYLKCIKPCRWWDKVPISLKTIKAPLWKTTVSTIGQASMNLNSVGRLSMKKLV